jgi:outer membrane protein assembly factor BamB
MKRFLPILALFFLARNTPAVEQREAWNIDLPEAVQGSLAAGDGCVYAALADGSLRAFRLEDGTEKWRKPTGGDVEAGVVYWDNTVVFADAWGRLRGFSSKTGEPLWDSRLQSRALSIGAGGNTVCVGEAGACSAFSLSKGGSLWRFIARGEIQSAPWVGDDMAVFGGTDHRVYFVDVKTGRENTSILLSGEIIGGPGGEPAAARRPAVAVGTHENKVHLVLQDGKRMWTVRLRGVVRAAPLLLPDVLIAGTDAGMLYSIDRDSGRALWGVALGGAVVDQLVPLGETVGVGAGGTLNFVRVADGVVEASMPVGGVVRSVAGASGRVIASTTAGHLMASGARLEAGKAKEKAPEGVVSLVVEPRRLNVRKGETLAASFALLDARPLTVDVAEKGGRRVKLLDNRDKAFPRTYQYEWDGRDEKGKLVASGIYRLRVVAGDKEFNVGVEVLGRR